MKKILIFGASGFAKEVFFLIKEIGNYQVLGFIDIGETKELRIGKESYPIFNESEINHLNECDFSIGIGNPKIIKSISEKYNNLLSFPNLIHPSVIFHKDSISIGCGNIITAGCVLTTDIKISSFNILNLNTTIGHDTSIGNGNVINPGSNISGGVSIGDYNLLGTNCTILQNISVGNNSILGAAALLTKDLPDNSLAKGVPAKF